MLLHAVSDITLWLTHLNWVSFALPSFDWGAFQDHLVLAQNVPQTDLAGDLQKAFNNFVKTGQAWAFIIGLVLGYMVKTFTSFG